MCAVFGNCNYDFMSAKVNEQFDNQKFTVKIYKEKKKCHMLPSCPIFSMSWGKKVTIALQAQTLL